MSDTGPMILWLLFNEYFFLVQNADVLFFFFFFFSGNRPTLGCLGDVNETAVPSRDPDQTMNYFYIERIQFSGTRLT